MNEASKASIVLEIAAVMSNRETNIGLRDSVYVQLLAFNRDELETTRDDFGISTRSVLGEHGVRYEQS